MAVQMFLVQPRNTTDERARDEIADLVTRHEGFILMATSHGSIIAAIDDVHLPVLKAHPEVDFVGGVTLDPNGRAATKLQRLFAHNVAAQLTARSAEPPSVAIADLAAPTFPPGYRPIRPAAGPDTEWGSDEPAARDYASFRRHRSG